MPQCHIKLGLLFQRGELFFAGGDFPVEPVERHLTVPFQPSQGITDSAGTLSSQLRGTFGIVDAGLSLDKFALKFTELFQLFFYAFFQTHECLPVRG